VNRIQSGSVVVRTSSDVLGSEPVSSGFIAIIGDTLLTLTGHSGYVLSVAWSPDGTKIATASDDGTARVWSSSSGSTLLTLTGHSSYVLSVAWSPDGTKIATASFDNTARVYLVS
jgi:WD40 repeat protein